MPAPGRAAGSAPTPAGDGRGDGNSGSRFGPRKRRPRRHRPPALQLIADLNPLESYTATVAPPPWGVLGLLMATKIGVTMAVADRYGWHRVELYSLASSRHLSPGYVDYPPITPLLARIDQAIFPGSLPGLRLLTVLAGAALIVIAALIARELGGGRASQALAGLAVLMSPLFVGANILFQTVSFDQLIWAAACLIFVRLLRGADRRAWLLLGLVFGIGLETKYTIIACELLFFAAGGKAYYPAPIYPLAYAAGSIWFVEIARFSPSPARGGGSGWGRLLVAGAVAVTLVLLPIGLPVLSAQAMADSGIWKARKDFADMYGWPELAQQVTSVSAGLPATDRNSVMILAANYGEAGALDLYGRGLPPLVSPHLTYYYCAPTQMAPATVIAVGYSRADLATLFGSIQLAGTVANTYGLRNDEYGQPVWVCRDPLIPLGQAWPTLKSLE